MKRYHEALADATRTPEYKPMDPADKDAVIHRVEKKIKGLIIPNSDLSEPKNSTDRTIVRSPEELSHEEFIRRLDALLELSKSNLQYIKKLLEDK